MSYSTRTTAYPDMTVVEIAPDGEPLDESWVPVDRVPFVLEWYERIEKALGGQLHGGKLGNVTAFNVYQNSDDDYVKFTFKFWWGPKRGRKREVVTIVNKQWLESDGSLDKVAEIAIAEVTANNH